MKIISTYFTLLFLISRPLIATGADDGFVPIDPATINSVSGKNLMLVSYAVILGLLVVYSLFLFQRDKMTTREIEALQKSVKR